MPRSGRNFPGGLVYHVLSRAVARLPLFEKPADDAAFERVLGEALDRLPMRILTFTLMPNHWHLILWPEHDEDLTAFCRWATHTHSMRWHAHYHTSGTGHIYQGRFKAFPVETDDYFYTVCRYVERNALRAKLVERAEEWRWSGLWRRIQGDEQPRRLLSNWPLPFPKNWLALVQACQTESELQAVRRSVQRGSPFGSDSWQEQTAERLGIKYSLRPRGRPKKNTSASHSST